MISEEQEKHSQSVGKRIQGQGAPWHWFLTFQADAVAVAPGPLPGRCHRRHPKVVVLPGLQVRDVQGARSLPGRNGWRENGDGNGEPGTGFYCLQLEWGSE